jgi:hypothetical protein
MNQFAGETIQFKFRSHGSNTLNFNYWYINTIFCEFTYIPPSGTLEIIAADSSGNPIEGVTVNAVSPQLDVYYNAYTNESGEFTISPMISGEYLLTCYPAYALPVVYLIYIQSSAPVILDITPVLTMSISPTSIDTTMAPDDSMAVCLTLHNHRDVPIHWFANIVNTNLNEKVDTVFQDASISKNVKWELETYSVNDKRPFYFSNESEHGIMAPGESFDWCLVLDTSGQPPGTILEFEVVFTTDPNVGTFTVPVTVTVNESGINNEPDVSAQLYQNHPNPFSTSTKISFNLHPRDAENAEIKIYNIKGQLVKEFKIKNSKFKIDKVVWDGTNERGKQVPNGIYFYQLTLDGKVAETKKMIILR